MMAHIIGINNENGRCNKAFLLDTFLNGERLVSVLLWRRLQPFCHGKVAGW